MIRTLGVLGFLLVLEAAGRLGLIEALPPVSVVLVTAAGLAADGSFLSDVGATLSACAAGLLIAVVT
ncbi:ABC transporter permease, partial [Nonomuraea dietziae]